MCVTRVRVLPLTTQGSGTIKAGFAGQDTPKCFFPSFVGRPKHRRAMAGAVEGDRFIGRRAQELRGLLRIRYPMEHGIVNDWGDMERIWSHVYSEELKTLSEEHPVLLTEAPLNPRANRDAAAQIFFETFNVPALYISIQAILSLYSSGRTTGVVLDSGDGVTHAVPVYEGFSMPHAIQRIDVAGRDVTDHLQTQLRRAGYYLHTSSEREIVRAIKERCCQFATQPLEEHAEAKQAVEFALPDGNVIKVRAAPATARRSPTCSWAPSASAHPRCSSTPSCSGSRTPARTRSCTTRSHALTSTCGATCTETFS